MDVITLITFHFYLPLSMPNEWNHMKLPFEFAYYNKTDEYNSL